MQLPTKTINMKGMFLQGLFEEIVFVGRMSHSKLHILYLLKVRRQRELELRFFFLNQETLAKTAAAL